MSLRLQAESDLSFILENVNDFGWDVTVTDPAGTSAELIGFANDIAQLIDPDTGQSVSGRLAAISLRISSLTAAGLGLPEGIADSAIKPWIIEFNDVNGNPFKFKVAKSNPDRALGVVTCILENYGDSNFN